MKKAAADAFMRRQPLLDFPLFKLLDESAFLQQNLNIGALDLLQDDLKHLLLLEGQRCLTDRLLVDGVIAGTQQFPHIVLAAPHLRHAAVNVQQGVDRLHAGTHGILGGEDGVTGRLGKLTDEGEVHSAIGHDLRTVGLLTRLEEGIDIRHKAGGGVAGIVCQRIDLFGRHADVVQPLTADLLASAVPHGLLYIVAFLIGVQRIQPHKHHVLILGLELRLAVNGPGEIPVVGAVLDGDNAAGGYLCRSAGHACKHS